jgi:hypothetical protein
MMTIKEAAEILATVDKMKIENDPNLSREQKEALKLLIDWLKDSIR